MTEFNWEQANKRDLVRKRGSIKVKKQIIRKKPKNKGRIGKFEITDQKIRCSGCQEYGLPGDFMHRPTGKTYRHFGRCPNRKEDL